VACLLEVYFELDLKKMVIKVFVDGSSAGNPWRWGWAVVIVEDDKVKDILQWKETKATNSQMEVKALLEGLRYIAKNFKNQSVEIFSDSQYVVSGATKWLGGWKARWGKRANGEKVAWWEMWQEIDSLLQNLPNVKIFWIRGHSGQKFNELADRLAKGY